MLQLPEPAWLRIDAGGIGEGGVIDYSKAVSYAYNADGTTSFMTDKNGVTTSYSYDIHGRTLSTTAGSVTVGYTYDEKRQHADDDRIFTGLPRRARTTS